MKTVPCPNCVATIIIASFSAEEELASGKHAFCPGCGQMVWVPVGDFPPTNFPHATNQEGHPRILRTT